MTGSADRRFPSKVDAWLVGLVVLFLVVPGGATAFSGAPAGVPLLIVGSIAAFFVWLLMSTDYEVTPTTLKIRSGPLRWAVPMGSISSIRPTRNPVSSPALSLDRLEVRYGSRFILISPRDKAAFVAAVRAVAPGVVFDDARGADAARRGRRTLSVVRLVVFVQVLVVALIGVVFYMGTRAPLVEFATDRVTFSGGMHSRVVMRTDIVDISLVDTLPAARKRYGFGGGSYERGVFDVATLGRADLFIKRGVPPYVVIKTTSSISSPLVVVNFPDAVRSRVLYEQLQGWRR